METENAGYRKDYLSFGKKRARPRKYLVTTTFGKPLFITQYRMSYAIYIPPNTKDLTIDLAMLAYRNRQNVIKFARANDYDLLQALKYLMGTRL